MAGIQNRHIIPLRHFVDGVKQRKEILLGVDVFLTIGGKEDISSLFQPQSLMNFRRFYLCKIMMQHLCHRGASYIGVLLRQPAICNISSGVFRVCHVDIRNDVHNAAVGFFRQALILAAVSGFHVEDRNMQTLCTDDKQELVSPNTNTASSLI